MMNDFFVVKMNKKNELTMLTSCVNKIWHYDVLSLKYH